MERSKVQRDTDNYRVTGQYERFIPVGLHQVQRSRYFHSNQEASLDNCFSNPSRCQLRYILVPNADSETSASDIYRLTEDTAQEARANQSSLDMARAIYYEDFKNRYFKSLNQVI